MQANFAKCMRLCAGEGLKSPCLALIEGLGSMGSASREALNRV